MKKTMAVAILLATLGATVRAEGSTLITFDDIAAGPPPGGALPVANGYAGLDWNNIGVLNSSLSDPDFHGYYYAAVSGPNVAFTGGDAPGSFSSASAFTLDSMYLTAQYIVTTAPTQITGYLNGIQKYSATVSLSDMSPTLETLNWTDIDAVTIGTSYGTNTIMDNILIEPVPLPTAAWLLLSGLGALGFAGRKARPARIEGFRKEKPPGPCDRGGFLIKSLAVTYSGMPERHTTIGAERFHFRVRNGIGWFPLAMAARQTV